MTETTSRAKLIFAHLRATLTELWRTPGFLVPTILFPSMLYLFFGDSTGEGAQFRLAAFAVYGVMGVTFYQFGVGLAEDRETPWETFLRTLPIAATDRFAARIAAAFVVSAVTVLVLAVAGAIQGVTLSPGQWLRLAAALAVGAVPFGFLGIALGYLVSGRAAVPIANLIYLPLAYLGAVWVRPENLPHTIATLSPALPSRQFAELAWAAIANTQPAVQDLAGLAAYGATFAAVCVWGYQRNEKRNYR